MIRGKVKEDARGKIKEIQEGKHGGGKVYPLAASYISWRGINHCCPHWWFSTSREQWLVHQIRVARLYSFHYIPHSHSDNLIHRPDWAVGSIVEFNELSSTFLERYDIWLSAHQCVEPEWPTNNFTCHDQDIVHWSNISDPGISPIHRQNRYIVFSKSFNDFHALVLAST